MVIDGLRHSLEKKLGVAPLYSEQEVAEIVRRTSVTKDNRKQRSRRGPTTLQLGKMIEQLQDMILLLSERVTRLEQKASLIPEETEGEQG